MGQVMQLTTSMSSLRPRGVLARTSSQSCAAGPVSGPPAGATTAPQGQSCPDDTPVPNTEYKLQRPHYPEQAPDDQLVLSPEALEWYEAAYKKREGVADEAQASAGETEFSLGDSLRVTWIAAQRADKTLLPLFGAKTLAEGYRIALDGLLERLVNLPPPAGGTWVPIVPDGQATAHLT